MCDAFAPIDKLITCRCRAIKRLFGEFARQPPRSFEFLNRLPEIEASAERKPEESNRRLIALLGELVSATDGMGSTILNIERFERFIVCHGEASDSM